MFSAGKQVKECTFFESIYFKSNTCMLSVFVKFFRYNWDFDFL